MQRYVILLQLETGFRSAPRQRRSSDSNVKRAEADAPDRAALRHLNSIADRHDALLNRYEILPKQHLT